VAEDRLADVWPAEDPVGTLLAHLRWRYDDHPAREELFERFEAHLPDLWRAFSAVYGEDVEAVGWLLEAVEAAVEGYENRPEHLRKLDRERVADRREATDRASGEAAWFQGSEQLSYMCYVDNFAGDLGGIRDRLAYLDELGVSYLHLMPLLASREGRDDGGYAVTDYRSVDPALGGMDELRALATDLHERDMVLALDVVMNHTAREHEWAQAAKAGEQRYLDFYITFEDRELPDQYEQTVPEVFPDFATGNFTHVEELDQWVWTSFYDFQWDLDYSNPDLFVQMFREIMFLVNVGTDVLRLDAVPFLWKELGTNCRNLPEAHWILRAYRALSRIAAPGVLFKAEAIVAPEETVKYLGTGGHEGTECDLAYNAPLMAHLWHALASGNTRLLEQALSELPPTPAEASWLNYVRCHDDIGWGLDDDDVRAMGQDPTATRRWCADFYAGDTPDSFAEGYRFQVEDVTGEARTSGTAAALTGLQWARVEGDDEDVDTALQRLLLMHNAVFAAPGIPLLYSGDELAQSNDYAYLTDPIRAQDNRWVHRPEMDWEAAARRHDDGSVEQRVFDGIARLARTRAGTDAFHQRAREQVHDVGNDTVFVLERGEGEGRRLCLSNFSNRPQAVDIGALPERWDCPGYTETLAGRPALYPDGRFLLEPYGYRWLAPDPDATPGPAATTTVELDVETEWGQGVFLTGDHPALGNWDVAESVPMRAEEHPTWRTELDLPEGTYVEFEWLTREDGRAVEWSGDRYWIRAGSDRVWRL